MSELVSPSITLPDGTKKPVVCTQCGNQRFEQEVAKSESRWGMTQHRTLLFVCVDCSHIESFYSDRVIFFGQV